MTIIITSAPYFPSFLSSNLSGDFEQADNKRINASSATKALKNLLNNYVVINS